MKLWHSKAYNKRQTLFQQQNHKLFQFPFSFFLHFLDSHHLPPFFYLPLATLLSSSELQNMSHIQRKRRKKNSLNIRCILCYICGVF
jgi:hypothetical protein